MEGISEAVNVHSHFLTANGNVLVGFSGNTSEAIVECHSVSSVLKGKGSGKHVFPRCFVKQTCDHRTLSGNVARCDACVGCRGERGRASNTLLPLVRNESYLIRKC